MRTRSRIALIALLLGSSLIATDAEAAETMTPNTLRLARNENPPRATIADMAWFVGTWRGSGLGGDSEEIWSAPRGGTMMGMYRRMAAGRPVFYEFLTLIEEHDSLALRLRHFHPDLRGWEERNESQRMPLVAKRDGRLYFDGLTFEPGADGTVTIYLAVQSGTGPMREEVFRYEKQR